MLSSNNRNEYLRKQEPKKQRFTIKKLTVGVASVLIGFTFMGLSASASANETTDSTPVETSATQSGTTDNHKEVTPEEGTTNDAQAPADQLAAQPDQSATGVNASQSSNNKNTQPVAVTPKAATAQQTSDVADWQGFVGALSDANVGTINLTQDINVTGGVSGLTGGQAAGYRGTLTLTGQGIARTVTINGNGKYAINFNDYALDFQDANQKNSAESGWNITFKDVTITGKKLHTFNTLSQHQYSNVDASSFAPFNFVDVSADNQANDTVIFDGVTADVEERPIITGHKNNSAGSANINGEKYTLILKGTNNLTNKAYTGGGTPGDDGNAISAGYVIVENGTTTINMPQTSSYNLQYGGAAVRAAQSDLSENGTVTKYSVDVKNGAALNITGGKDVKGIVTANAITGTVNVDGNVNMNMGAGHSIAMLAGNLNVGKTGNVDITTAQVQTGDKSITNFDSGQYGVLSIGVGYAGNLTNVDNNNINDNGSIKIVRTSTANSYSPMISMGSGASGLLKGNFTVNVNEGATLDLQDSEDQTKLGMIFVSGSSVAAHVNFNNPGYVNLQRMNALPNNGSDLIYLEGQPNGVTITQSPIAQWDEANMSTTPSWTWLVKSVSSMNNWGDNAGTGFTAAGQTSPQNGSGDVKFLHSNGSVIMAPSQSGLNSFQYDGSQTATNNSPQGLIKQGTAADGSKEYAPYLNQFLNHFNYWTPQRLAMGSKLINNQDVVTDADKYQPETQTINGTTDQTLAQLDAKKGIKDLIKSDGTTTEDLSSIKSVDWYSDQDAAQWNKQMLNADGTSMTQPTNPTGNLKTTDKSAWAKVTYNDGSVDFVNIPLNITEPDQQTLADQYAPDGGTISVAENHILDGTDAANGITNKDQLVDQDGNSVVKTDDGYTWKVAPDTKTPGDKAGVVTVTYTDGSTDDVPVVVHVMSQAETNDPKGQDITVNKGETPDPSQGISNKDQMPSGTKYTWPDGKTPDTSKPGKVPADVVVTYPDGSQDVVPTTVVVKDPSTTPSTDKSDADKNDPKGQTVDTTLGNVPDAEKAISNTGDLPKGTKYEWSQTPNVYSKGEHPGVVKVSYPDDSVDYVPASVNVTNEPTGKTVTTPKGTVPKADTTIDWGNGTEPSGTTVEWQTEPDVSTPGTHPGTVKITYPDGENTTVPVNVVVTDDSSTADNDFNPYGTTIDVPYGHTMDSNDAKKAIAGGVPANATNVSYDWATNVDTTKPGLTQAYVKVTATLDGKTQTKTVPVYVKVGTQAENYNPEGQNLTVNKGATVPDAKTAIANADTLPAGTKYTWAITPDTNTVGTQSVLVKVTYPDNSVDYVPVNVTVKDNLSDADKYQPEYAPVSVEPGTTATAKPTWSTENGNEGEPTGETFTPVTKGDNLTPAWAQVATDGTVTLNPRADQKPGDYLIPVTVTYADGTSEVVNVPVAVKGATQHDNTVTYYGQNQTTSMTVAEYITHKTSDGTVTDITAPAVTEIIFKNQDSKWNVVSSVTYKLQGDKYVATTPITNPDGSPIQLLNGTYAPESFDASDISTQWQKGFEPNTNVDNYQSDGTKDGKGSGTGSSLASTQYAQAPNGDQRTVAGQNLPGNSKTRVTITVQGQAATALGGNGLWSNAFGNIYGATTGETLTFKQNQDISNLTQDQYRQLIDVTDLGKDGWNGQNINPNAPQVLAYVEGTDANKQFTMIWAPNVQPSTANVANGVKGVVRIIFNDGTYLDVPAAINVVKDDNAGKEDQDKTEFSQKIIYTYNGKEVATTSINNIKKGTDVSADALKSAIDSNVPDNYTIASGYTYPAGLTNVTATPDTIEVPLALKSGETFTMTGKMVYQTADGKTVADGPQIKSNKGDTLTAALLHDLADHNLPKNYEIVTYPGSFNVTEDNFTIPVIVKQSSNKINYDPNNKDMNKEVVRTITIYKTDGTTQKVLQTVHFVRGGESQVAETIDPDGTINWTPWTVATKDGNTWKSNGAKVTTGAWDEYNVDQVNGYTSTVDGKNAIKVAANNNITPDTANVNVTVAYTKTTSPDDHNIDPTNPGENSDMFAHPTRTINVTDPNTGAINTTKQTVWFGRTKTTSTDPSVGTTYGNWQLGKIADGHFVIDTNANSTWPKFDAPVFDGYTPSQAKVDAENVSATTGDTEVNITYTKTDNGNHDNGGNTTPTPGDNGDHNNGNENGITNNNRGIKNTDNGANNNANNNKRALPQTGNDQSAAAGLGLAGLATMLGLAGLKKRKND